MNTQAQIARVTQLLAQLESDLQVISLTVPQRRPMLEQLKVLGRTKEYAGPIFAQSGLRTICRLAFDTHDVDTMREAMRCLANAMLLEPKTRQMVVDMGYGPKAAEKLESDNHDDEFLCARILFLMTYDTNLDYDDLVTNHRLATSMNAAMSRHAQRYSKKQTKKHGPIMQMESMAIAETLKLMFNITHHYPDLTGHFSPSIPTIFKILVRADIPRPALTPPVCYLVNALVNLDLEDKKGQQLKLLGMNSVFPTFDTKINANRLIDILDRAIDDYTVAELEEKISPLLALIRRVHEIAPKEVKRWMRWLLLPSDDERNAPLGTSDTLASRLLRLSNSAPSQTLRSSISALLFECSDKDATQFVQNVGYGFASGFLMSHNIEMPQSALEASATSGGPSDPIPVNPITGQRLDKESPDTSTPMTEEEKLRESERLFVLFDRLKATGVVDVENPVRKAYESGRIYEIPDDEDEDKS